MEFLTPAALEEVRPSFVDVETKYGNLRVIRLPLEGIISLARDFGEMPDELVGDDVDQGEYLRFIIPILSRSLEGDWDNEQGHRALSSLPPAVLNKLQESVFELNGAGGLSDAIEEDRVEAKNE